MDHDAPIGWEANHPAIMAAATATRSVAPFDPAQRALVVEDAVRVAGRFSFWPLALLLPASILPDAGVWVALVAIGWLVYVITARLRAVECRSRMEAESDAIRAATEAEAATLSETIRAAERGGHASLQALLTRWLSLRPASLATFDAALTKGPDHAWVLTGSAVTRDAIPAVVPVLGHRNRVVLRTRKARDIDDDLSELNASAVLSLLVALFSGAGPTRVSVRITMKRPNGPGSDPWVRLERVLSPADIAKLRAARQPSTIIQELQGGVGRVHAGHVTPAPTPTPSSGSSDGRYVPLATRPDPAPSVGARVFPPGSFIPPRPAASAPHVPDGAPTLRTMPRDFAVAARQYADYPGEPGVPFVPFTHYWPTYGSMRADQLRFYFSWRGAVRALDPGEPAPETDGSYVYTHVYELLQLVGAESPMDAARQMERLWLAYRERIPSLDVHLISWIGDLYVMHVSPTAASDWVLRAVSHGAVLGEQLQRLVLDRYWAAGDFRGMPIRCLNLLTGDQSRGTTRFFDLHNADGWVVGGLRMALAAADRAYAQENGRSVRDDERSAFTPLAHQAFPGALVVTKHPTVQWGTVPSLLPGSRAVRFYRLCTRYAENLLRTSKGFVTLQKVVPPPPSVAVAIQQAIAAYIDETRIKPQVVINLARAAELAEESVGTRARLLAGLDMAGDDGDAVQSPATDSMPVDGAAPAGTAASSVVPAKPEAAPRGSGATEGLDGFGATELAALALLAAPAVDGAAVTALAAKAGTTVLQLVDRLNECGLDSPFGDLLVEPDAMPPALLPDAVEYVGQLLQHAGRA